ncbi:hypothetical protein [Alteraurantiacibacter palmitatis]|uniref:Lipoprotein n=1 Tax=Alteraurantiacibacter palmitatis TaxID=2054628 RepID=A0ABV7E2N7_9SPHN
MRGAGGTRLRVYARRDLIRVGALFLPLLLAGCATLAPQRLATFEAALAAQDSATAALGQWCAARGLADPPTIRAVLTGGSRPASPAIRAALGVSPDEAVAYRQVALVCGDTVLSRAENWYVPARLTADMNRTLEHTTTPFGAVVAPLGFRRERGTAQRGRAPDCPAGTVLSHSAVLRLPDGRAISAVVECYTAENLR